jgi:hypothetical protein
MGEKERPENVVCSNSALLTLWVFPLMVLGFRAHGRARNGYKSSESVNSD